MHYKESKSTSYCLRRLKFCATKAELLNLLYIAYIRSILEYACLCFVSLNHLLSHQLSKIDKPAHRLIFHYSMKTCHCSSDEITIRRHELSMRLFLKAANEDGHCLRGLMLQVLTNSGKFLVPLCCTQRNKNAFIPVVTSQLNNA